MLFRKFLDESQTVVYCCQKAHETDAALFQQGALWTTIERIIETPLFVDSSLASLVQVADLCAYALRRYLENQKVGLFKKILERADRNAGRVVGVRHFSPETCDCEIYWNHRGTSRVAAWDNR